MNYALSLDKNSWFSINGLVNIKKVSITQNLCTTEFKSAVDTAKIELVPSSDLSLWSDTLSLLMSADTVYAKIYSGTETFFYGVIDKSNLSIETKKIPSSCSLSLQDVSTIYLDKTPKTFSVYRSKTISEIVTGILDDIGFPHYDITLDEEDNVTLEAFIVNPDESDEYRDLIDNLLFESGGYVLNTKETGIAEVVKLNWAPASSEPKRVIQSQTLISTGIKTEASILDEDGLYLTYYTLAETEKDSQGKQQAVYVGVTSLSKTDNGELEGDTIESAYFYPEDGDLEQAYIDYDESLLDKAYNVGLNRKSNDALAIVDVTDTELSIRAQAYNDSGEIQHDIIDNSKAFSFPLIYDMQSNPTYYPNKAWVLVKNIYGKKINLLEFTIRGKVLYKDRQKNILLPDSAKNPEEYEAKTIYTEERATKFANFYWHFKKNSRYVSTWKENSYGTLGELVLVNHKETEFGQSALVVAKTVTFIREDFPQVSLTGVAVGEWSEYPLKNWGNKAQKKRLPITSISTYYIVENSKTKPASSDSRWAMNPGDVTESDRFRWKKEIVTYQNETAEEDILLDLIFGEKGEDGSYLSFSVTKTLIDCYADGTPVSDEVITFTASSDLDMTLYINSTLKKTASGSLSYEATPTEVFGTEDSVIAKVLAGSMEQSYTISKVKRTGILELSADKLEVGYYADNVAHDANEEITLTVYSEGYSITNYPKIYLNGELQTDTAESTSYMYKFKPSAKFGTSDSILVKAVIGEAVESLIVTKVKDKGSINIDSSLTTFDYYADNVPANTADNAVLTITQQGYSVLPDLYLNNVKTSYSSGSYVLSVSACQNVTSIVAMVKNDYESKSITITKIKRSPDISISASVGAVDYYYDNAPASGDITVQVNYSGLFYAPLCRAGNTAITLDSTGKGTIPVSLFKDVTGGLIITAYAQKNIVCESSITIPKNVYPLILSLGASSTQFVYDSESNPSPESITLTNNTTGLSDKNLVSLVVGGEIKAWTDDTFTLTPDMVINRYIAISIGYGTETRSMLITKTFDGKNEEVEYAKTKSFTIYPSDDYSFIFNSEGLIYNGETILWASLWSKTQPDISSIEYLWRRARKDSSEEWQYTRLTGVKGSDGKGAGTYLGHYTEHPNYRSDGSSLENGDYYLNTLEVGAPVVYRYNSDSDQWLLVTTTDSDWSQIAAAVMNDVNNYGGALLSTSAFYGFFQLLSAQKAFIRSLGTQEITLNNGGEIKSENYDESNGAEGFRISSDGDVDFNNGVWRGSFANGLSFIPPTNLTVKKTMTHKEVYQLMKKTGICEGTYLCADSGTFVNDGYFRKNPTKSPNTMDNLGQGFNLLEYSNNTISCSIPLYCPTGSGLIPLTTEISILFDIATTTTDGVTSISSKSAYLVSKSMLCQHLRNLDKEILYQYPIDISSWYINSFLDSDHYIVALYGCAIGGKFITLTANSGNTFNVYSLNEESMSLVLDGSITLSTWGFVRWIFPTFPFHKQSSVYSVAMLGSSNQFKFTTTTDLLNYTDVDGPYTYTPTTGTNLYMPLDIIKVNGRIFAQIIEQFKRSDTQVIRYYFAEYDSTTQTFVQVPDEYTCAEGVSSINIVPLQEKDGVIIGTFSGYDMFTYNTNTNVFTDISGIFQSAVPYATLAATGYTAPVYTVQQPQRCFRSDNSDADSKKYSKTFYNPNITVCSCQYSEKFGKFLISIEIGDKSESIFATYKYDTATGDYEMMSPMFLSERTKTSPSIPNISPYVEDDSGEYSLAFSNHCLLTSYVDESDYTVFEINNFTGADLIDCVNGDKTTAQLFGNDNLPRLYSSWGEFLLSLSKNPFKNDSKLLYSDDTKLKFNCVSPFLNVHKIFIREDDNTYKIILGSIDYHLSSFNFFILNIYSGYTYVYMQGCHVLSNGAHIEPIITIDKDSEEEIGVSFYWDFPAQLTVREDIKNVVRADIFRDDFIFE